jgi:DNA-binding transcriptional regulator LsrR (DeoR family)
MPSTNTDMFLAAKRYLRLHPELTNEQVADQLNIPRALIQDIVVVARREVDLGV